MTDDDDNYDDDDENEGDDDINDEEGEDEGERPHRAQPLHRGDAAQARGGPEARSASVAGRLRVSLAERRSGKSRPGARCGHAGASTCVAAARWLLFGHA
jgi:hypothetical protein